MSHVEREVLRCPPCCDFDTQWKKPVGLARGSFVSHDSLLILRAFHAILRLVDRKVGHLMSNRTDQSPQTRLRLSIGSLAVCRDRSAFPIDPGTRLAIPPKLGGLCGDFPVIDRRVWIRNRRAHFAHRLEVGNCPQPNGIAPWPRPAASAIKESESLKLRGKSHAHRPTTRHHSQRSPRSRSV